MTVTRQSFRSTRGSGPVDFRSALFQGLAPDGGLYVPCDPMRLGALDVPPGAPFPTSAVWAAKQLMEGMLPADVIQRITTDSLDFDAPLVEVEDGVHVLELFHGPSLAFKDVGARFMARAMAELMHARDRRTVLVATSGDTGGAVAAAFHGPGTGSASGNAGR